MTSSQQKCTDLETQISTINGQIAEKEQTIASLTKDKESLTEECKRVTEAVLDLEKKQEELES